MTCHYVLSVHTRTAENMKQQGVATELIVAHLQQVWLEDSEITAILSKLNCSEGSAQLHKANQVSVGVT
ncbi:hypothetical protein ACO1PK_05455 [Alishewanella sp. d11]|uniref:hypothetical protein n=1 Tax=Alishewanella sp. d11 TaxID=3414030 RepID=UPI003BF852F2